MHSPASGIPVAKQPSPLSIEALSALGKNPGPRTIAVAVEAQRVRLINQDKAAAGLRQYWADVKADRRSRSRSYKGKPTVRTFAQRASAYLDQGTA